MKTCVSIPGGAIRSITCVPEIIEYISCELGYSLFDATDQSIATSAGAITVTQNALDITSDMRKNMPLKAFFNRIDQQNKENVTEIFQPRSKLQMLGINPKTINGKFDLFQAPQDNTILPRVIDEDFNAQKMSDFSMRTAFTIYMPLENGEYGVKLITSYDTPNCPVSAAVGATCSFPLSFGAYDLKSEWLNQGSGKIIKAFDGGLGCPNPAIRGLEEVQEIADIDEEIAIFSMMLTDKKNTDYQKLYAGGTMRWLDPLKGSPLTRVAFNALFSNPDRQLQQRSQSRHSRGLLKYYPIHLEINDADRKKYKVSFDSMDASPDNLNAFQELSYSRVRTDQFRKSLEPAIRAFDDRMTEKRNEQYKDNVIPITRAPLRENSIQISAMVQHNVAAAGANSIRPS